MGVPGGRPLCHRIVVRSDPSAASERADDATHCARQVEKVYRAAIVALRADGGESALSVVTTYEAYRTLLGIADALVHVAHRVWYSVLKSG